MAWPILACDSSLRGAALVLSALALTAGCPARPGTVAVSHSVKSRLSRCPKEAPAGPGLPFYQPADDLVERWLQQYERRDDALLDDGQIAAINRAALGLQSHDMPRGRWNVLESPRPFGTLHTALRDALGRFERAALLGKRVLEDGSRPTALVAELKQKIDVALGLDELRLVLRSTAVRCFPTEQGIYEEAFDRAFDQMQCAQLSYGELLRVRAASGRYRYVFADYTFGWVDETALSAPISNEQAHAYAKPAAFVVVTGERVALWSAPQGGTVVGQANLGARFPLIGRADGVLEVQAASADGVASRWIRRLDRVHEGYLPFTRRNVLETAFGVLHAPYGWGGMGHHRDCSQLMMDLFSVFGVRLPRNSLHQASSGAYRVDVHTHSDAEKFAAIRREAERGLVLLYLPGHIMLYLGQRDGQGFVFHLFSGYLVPCPGGGETMMRLNRTAVTSLELGRGGSRRAFIERITQLVVFGPAPPQSS